METIATNSNSPREEENNSLSKISDKKNSLSVSKKESIAKKKSTIKEILLFIVDDDSLYSTALEYSILNKIPDIKTKIFLTGEACLQQMKQKPDVVILDYFLDSKVPYAWNGLDILKQIKMLNPKTKVIMLSSQDSLDVAVKCIDNHSFDYISKSESAFVKINNVLKNIIEDVDANDKGLKQYQIIGIIVIIVMALCLLFFNS